MRLRVLIGVVAPIVDPKVMAPDPLFMVKFCAPSIVDVRPSNVMAAFVEVKLMA